MTGTNFSDIRTSVIKDIIQLSREKYVYPEIGEKISSQIQAKLENGEYDDITEESDLAFRLTMDLQTMANDRHWSVVYNPEGAVEQVDPENEDSQEVMEHYLEMARNSNYGFERIERLKGNIGYIDLRAFFPSEYGGETATAAMNFVANCDALIIDLRKNHGGYPSMVQLITSYLVDPEPRHINTFTYRSTEDTQQFWTFPYVPGKRQPDIQVYVLTSGATGSGAEEFAYNLKYMERATLIGETTVGAAHPVTKETIQGNFDVLLPYGRPINPITGSNWERTGVEPHIAVPAEEALKTAHLKAMEYLEAKCQDDVERKALQWEGEIVASDYSPVVVDETELSRHAGEYGQRSFSIENGNLFYSHQEIPKAWKLIPMSKTRFRLDDDIKFEFIFKNEEKASAVKINYRDGRPEVITNRT